MLSHKKKKVRRQFLNLPYVHAWYINNMIADFPVWLDGLLNYCELQINSLTRRQLLEESSWSRPAQENVSKHRRQVKPGEHSTKLKTETIERLNSLFSGILKELDYTWKD